MPLLDLIDNPQFNYYYGGTGNFTQNKMGWGDNGPLVQWPINGERISTSGDRLQNIIQINKSSIDYPLRGGANERRSPYGTTIPEAAYVDSIRIKRFLKSSPRGTTFLLKQTGLQASNPLIEVGTQINVSNDITTNRFLGVTEATRVYNNGINTLTQVSVGGSGIHADRHGIVPFNAPSSLYMNVVPRKTTDQNRLVVLYRSKILSEDLNRDSIVELSRMGISSTRDILFDYLGGPKSFYGIGSTTIRRYIDTNDLTDRTQQVGLEGELIGQVSPRNFNYSLNYNEIANMRRKDKQLGSLVDKESDFREIIEASSLRGSSSRTDQIRIAKGFWKEYNLAEKAGIGRPGTEQQDYGYYNKQDTYYLSRIDKLNALRLFYSEDNENPWEISNKDSKDIIKFGFESIDNDVPSRSVVILFRAFMDSFNDNHNAEYSTFKYIGRGDTFMRYQGFTRDITFSFKIAAQTRWEMEPLYNKLNALASQIYPDYSDNGYMRSPMLKLTVGDYIYRQPGFLKSIAITIEKDFPWEIKMHTELDKYMHQLPQILSVNCTFSPIHDFLPRKYGGLVDNINIIGPKYFKNRIIDNVQDKPIGDDEYLINEQIIDEIQFQESLKLVNTSIEDAALQNLTNITNRPR